MKSSNQLFGQLDCNFLISSMASELSFKEEYEMQWLDWLVWHSLLCFFILSLYVYILKKDEQKGSGVGCY